MANEKLNFTEIALLIFLLILFLLLLGCSSAPKADVSKPNVYYCPNKHEIPLENVNKDIRVINKCSECGAEFPYLESFGDNRDGNSYQQDEVYQGPKVFVRGFHRDIKYNNKVEHSVKNNWKMSDDGNSGSISSTTIRSYEHSVDGEYGTLVGPGAYYGYGGYGY